MKKILPILYTALLSSGFFWAIVALDAIMEKKLPVYSRDAISHLILILIILIWMCLSPDSLTKRGLNLKNWRFGLLLGVILALLLSFLFSFFSLGSNLIRWKFTNLAIQLKNKDNIVHLFSQLFLIGTSEEFFFRGILVTYLMKRYKAKFMGIHIGVIIVAVLGACLQFYKLLFGTTFISIFPFVCGGFLYFILLGWLYQKTESLLGPTVMHNLCNTLMFVMSLGI